MEIIFSLHFKLNTIAVEIFKARCKGKGKAIPLQALTGP
jgi:hypothetical protein